MSTTRLQIDTHLSVGPAGSMYGHDLVTTIGPANQGATVFVCLDCGYVTPDNRLLLHVDCDREKNPINTTWRERSAAFPDNE